MWCATKTERGHTQFGPAAEITNENGNSYYCLVMPYRGQTVLRIFDPDADRGVLERSAARGISPLIHRILALTDGKYGWDTPEYRSICHDFGLEPDQGRPTYDDKDKTLVSLLEERIGMEALTTSTCSS